MDDQMIKGSVSLMLLGLLDFSDMYGYQMIQELAARSSGAFGFKDGTLYPVLYEMEKAKLIESYWEHSEHKRRRKYYHITDQGRKALKDKRNNWQCIVRSVDTVLESLQGEVSDE